MTDRYTLGIDFGTESGRALLVNAATGEEVASCVYTYSNGVIDERLPDGTELGPDWALQDPEDWIQTLKITIPNVLRMANVSPQSVIGVGSGFHILYRPAY